MTKFGGRRAGRWGKPTVPSVGRLALAALLILIAAYVYADAPTLRRTVIHERGEGDHLICAEYTSSSAPREPNRACVDASKVRDYILRNAEPAECE